MVRDGDLPRNDLPTGELRVMGFSRAEDALAQKTRPQQFCCLFCLITEKAGLSRQHEGIAGHAVSKKCLAESLLRKHPQADAAFGSGSGISGHDGLPANPRITRYHDQLFLDVFSHQYPLKSSVTHTTWLCPDTQFQSDQQHPPAT